MWSWRIESSVKPPDVVLMKKHLSAPRSCWIISMPPSPFDQCKIYLFTSSVADSSLHQDRLPINPFFCLLSIQCRHLGLTRKLNTFDLQTRKLNIWCVRRIITVFKHAVNFVWHTSY
jgi:hypothetical protein